MIKKITSSLMVLSLSLMAESQAVLKLDTKGHTAIVNKLIVTKNKDIISASDDKTIRIYNSRNGLEKRKILGQISPGGGEVYCMALTPDEKYLAVGGYLDKEYGNIRIYNYQTGKLHKVIKGHTNVIYDMGFSNDGAYLITGSGDFTAKIWDARNGYSLKDTIKFHSNDVYGAKLFKRYGKYYALTAADDNKVALYDMQKKRVINSHKLSYNLSYISISDRHIAGTGSSKNIKIYDLDLNEIKTIKTKTEQAGVTYSQDGNFLITGTASSPRNVNVYDVNRNYAKQISFSKHTNLAMGVAFIDNDTAVSSGGDRKEMYIWDTHTGKVKQEITGAGKSVWSAGLNGDVIAWGSDWTANRGKSKFQKTMNLKDFSVKKISPNQKYKYNRIQSTKGSLSISHRRGGDYGYSDAVMDIKDSGRTLATVTKDSTDGFHHRIYGWYKDYVISGGSSGHLKVYNKQGKELASLVGHTSEIWSLSLEGDRLISSSGDQTMILWDLSAVNDYSDNITISPLLNFFISNDDEWVVWTNGGYFNASVGGDKYVGYHINQGFEKEARFVGSDKYFDTFYRPDIISLVLQTGSEKKAIAFASRTRKVETVEVSQSLPPVVTLTSQSTLRTSSKSTKVTFTVESKERVKEIIVVQNGKRITQRALRKKLSSDVNEQTYTIELDDGQNFIEIKARNAFAMSDSVTVDAFKTSQKKNIFKPTLYMLSIGVSRYENPEYNLGVADKDALAMSKLFKAQKGKIYKDVVTKTLTNENATSDNVLDALDWIDREVTSKDVAMIFVAGHGVNDDKGNYYFLSHDANLDKLRRSAVKWLEIQDTIKSLPSKVILLADTCHSGNITGTRRDITSAIKSITNSGSGSIIMTATTGSGYSYEQKSWGHGAFTKAILDGLGKHKADYDGDGSVSIKEIDLYVTGRVKELTKGKQKPTTIIPDSIPDFSIGVR